MFSGKNLSRISDKYKLSGSNARPTNAKRIEKLHLELYLLAEATKRTLYLTRWQVHGSGPSFNFRHIQDKHEE
jgi:hypothetical protein